MIPIVALMVIVIGGMLALAVDLGHVYQQRQQLQNTATSAAVAGAYQVVKQSGSSFGPTQDTKVALEMKGVIAGLGYAVTNIAGSGTYSTPPADACKAGYSPSQVSLQAEYLYRDTNAASSTYNQNLPLSPVVYVGSLTTTIPATTNLSGVKVIGLAGCVPAFFAAILGRQNFTAASDAQAASIVASVPSAPCTTSCTFAATNTPTPSPTPTTISSVPTATPTANTTATVTPPPGVPSGADAPFYIYGVPHGGNPMLFAQGSSGNSTGDKVTLFGNAGDWAGDQYSGSTDGQGGTPSGIQLHDASIIGCLDASTTTYVIGGSIDTSAFNHGGVGHCTIPALHLDEVVMIPVVDTICKNGDCSNGGWTVEIKAFVLVQLTLIDPPGAGGNSGNGHVIQGTIVGVVYDPYGIVQPGPLPTTTATTTATAVPTTTPIIIQPSA